MVLELPPPPLLPPPTLTCGTEGTSWAKSPRGHRLMVEATKVAKTNCFVFILHLPFFFWFTALVYCVSVSTEIPRRALLLWHAICTITNFLLRHDGWLFIRGRHHLERCPFIPNYNRTVILNNHLLNRLGTIRVTNHCCHCCFGPAIGSLASVNA